MLKICTYASTALAAPIIMLEMSTSDEVLSPANADDTPLPSRLGEMDIPSAAPTPSAVLDWISAAGNTPWFPSQYAAGAGVDRDALDDPLNQLRLAGLIRIAAWVRGMGQGYELTPAGERARDTRTGIPGTARLAELLPSDAYPAAAESSQRSTELPIDPRPSVIVPALLIANVLWFFVNLVVAVRNGVGFWSYMTAGDPVLLHRFGAVAGEDLLHGEWWRLMTACFVHAGAIHLLVNLFALAIVGPLAELQWGRRGFAAIYFLSCLGGSCLAMALEPFRAVVGASGGVWGMMIAVLVWFVVHRDKLPPDVLPDVVRRLVVTFLANIAVNLLPDVSWQAHLGGAMAGFFTSGLLAAVYQPRIRRGRLAVVLLIALPFAMVGALVAETKRADAWLALRRHVDDQQRQRKAFAIGKTYDEEVVPLLNRLTPEKVNPVCRSAGYLLLRPPAKRSPSAVADTRERLASLKGAADRILELLDVPPIGLDAVDQRVSLARRFAEVRSQSLGILLQSLERESSLDPSAWAAWGETKRTGDKLGQELLLLGK